MEARKMLDIVLVGVGTDCVSIVAQAINELREEAKIEAIIFDRDERYGELADRSYPQKTIEDIPGLVFDKLLICCKSGIMEEGMKLFCEELSLPRSKCGSYITHKIGPHKIAWDQVKTREDLVEQICFSEGLNDLERFFGGQNRALSK